MYVLEDKKKKMMVMTGEVANGGAAEEAAAGRSSGRRRTPGWLEKVMGPERGFFEGCGEHSDRRKNEKNIFCLRCCLSLCPHCLPAHPSHPLLQPYSINGAKVIFLNERPQTTSRSCKGSANICFNCDRILQEPFHFCSLQCKVDHMVYREEDLSDILRRFDESDFSISQFEGLRMDGSDQFGDESQQQQMMMNSSITTTYSTGNIILEEDRAGMEYGNSSTVVDHCRTEPSSRNTNAAGTSTRGSKKKGRGSVPTTTLGSRRKGAPHRAPLS